MSVDMNRIATQTSFAVSSIKAGGYLIALFPIAALMNEDCNGTLNLAEQVSVDYFLKVSVSGAYLSM